MTLVSLVLPLALAASPSSGGPSIAVTVLDSAGNTLPGATVSLIPWGECPETVAATALSDNLGIARVSIPKRGFYSIRFELETFLGGTVGPMYLPMEYQFQPTVRMYGLFSQNVGPPKYKQDSNQIPLVVITKAPK
jgi:hypothetical protein